MKPALIVIDELLQSTGMPEEEVDALMARFLEEEAFDYVRCVESFLQDEDNVIIH